MNYIEEIRNYMPQNEQEAQDKKVIMECLLLFPDSILSRENEIAHITPSGFIVNAARDKTLMIHHNIRNTWSWTGGHADDDKNLLAVAMREANEETGVTVIPLSEKIASLEVVTVQAHTRRGQFVNSHLHICVAYIFIADEREPLVVKPDENSAVAWIPVEEIITPRFTDYDARLYKKLVQRALDTNVYKA